MNRPTIAHNVHGFPFLMPDCNGRNEHVSGKVRTALCLRRIFKLRRSTIEIPYTQPLCFSQPSSIHLSLIILIIVPLYLSTYP